MNLSMTVDARLVADLTGKIAALEADFAALNAQPVQEPVALPVDLVIKALRAMDAEARKRGEMYPQTLDEQREDTKAVRNVIASLEFYSSKNQCSNGWPGVKDWPALYAAPFQLSPDPWLCKFYQVETYPALVEAQSKHIEKLQAKLPRSTEDLAFKRVREG